MVSPAQSASPSRLIQARKPFSCSLRKRSRSMTTKAGNHTGPAGSRGTRLATVILSSGLALGSHGCGLDGENFFQSAIHGRLHAIEKRLRIDAHPDDQRKDWHEERNFTAVQILYFLVLRMRERTEYDAAVHPQHINGPKNYARRGGRSPTRRDGKSAHQNQEFTDKTVQSRKTDGRKHHHHKNTGENRQRLPQATEVFDESRVAPVINHAD